MNCDMIIQCEKEQIMSQLRKKIFGDKAFYKMVLGVSVPIMIQMGITNFVSLLDNLMVGKVGTEQMSGVAIVNQLLMVYFLCIFGGISAAGIFTSQYFGQKDTDGVRNTFRFKLWTVVIITIIALVVFWFFGESLIKMYLNEGSAEGDLEATLEYAKKYLKIILISLPAFMIQQVYSSTMRECGKTITPMVAGVVAVLVNLVINYLLIFGKFGFPEMGVSGAAIGTTVSRYVEAGMVIWWTHSHKDNYQYIEGAYKTLLVPKGLTKKIIITGLPLLLNEGMWSAGMAAMLQGFSERGLAAVAGMNICNTIINLFSVMFIALGNSVAIIIGKLLGAGKMEEAKDTDRKMIVFAVLVSIVVAFAVYFFAPIFPEFYNATAEAKDLAKKFIVVQALFLPQMAFIHATYFTMRSGGKTFITFLFDSVFVWLVSVPLVFVLSRFTDMYVVWIYVAVQMADIIKSIVGFILVKKGVWIQNIVTEDKDD